MRHSCQGSTPDVGLKSVRVDELPPCEAGCQHNFQPPALAASSRSRPAKVSYRTLQPSDFESLRKAHVEFFPVDYEDAFFERVVHQQDGLESLAAVSRDAHGAERLVGFVTTRSFYLYECDATDRALLGLGHKLLDNETAFYILTLGVASDFRQQGIASALIRWVVSHARSVRSRAVYLHVIAYNSAAISLYRANGFAEVSHRQGFYVIWSERQPTPGQDVYDAYLYAVVIDAAVVRSPATLLLLAFAPLRGLLRSALACLPWSSPRGKYFAAGDYPSTPEPEGGGDGGSTPLGALKERASPFLRSLFCRRRGLQ